MNQRITNSKLYWFLAALLLILILTLALLRQGSALKKQNAQSGLSVPQALADGWWEERRAIYFGIPTRVVFKLSQGRQDQQGALEAQRVAALAWAEFDRIGKVFNNYSPDSDVSKLLNRVKNKQRVIVPEEIYKLIELSKEVFATSEGAFDPTVFPIKKLWKTAEQKQNYPSTRELAEALSQCGMQHVRLLPGNELLFEKSQLEFDFGGIVKGYAVDKVRELLLREGVAAGLVQNGGEIATFGAPPEDTWSIGVQHPLQLQNIWTVLAQGRPLRVSTSGNYRQPIQIEGREYYHIFDPRTALPVPTRVLGVTMVDLDQRVSNAKLDAVSKIIPVLGPEKGIALVEAMGIEVLVLLKGNKPGAIEELASPRLRQLLKRAQ